MIRVGRSGPVRVVTLDAPPVNAMTPALLAALTDAIEHRDDARAAVLDADHRCFSAGFDLRAVGADGDDQPVLAALLTGLARVIEAMHAGPLPVVAAVHGAALAGGCALLGGADVVVASEDASLGYPAALIGVSPAVSAPFLLRAVHDGPARRLLLDTRPLDAREALAIGLVHEIVPGREALRARAVAIAEALAAKPGSGVRETRAWLDAIAGPDARHRAAGLDASMSCVGTPESLDRIRTAARSR